MTKTLSKIIEVAIGEASMCWNPIPKGVFDSDKASEITKRAKQDITELDGGEVMSVEEIVKLLEDFFKMVEGITISRDEFYFKDLATALHSKMSKCPVSVDFEQFLMEKHAEDYVGTDDMMPDTFNTWVQDLSPDEFIEYGDLYAKMIMRKKK